MGVKKVAGGIVKWTGKSISFLRVALLNLVFIISLVMIYITLQRFEPPTVPSAAVLWLNPTGVIVDQYSFNDPLMKYLSPEQVAQETSLSDITTAIELAANDEKIKAVVLDVDKVSGVGLSSINSIHKALAKVKAADKPIYAFSRGLRQHQYLLVSVADQIVLHPMGYVAINGYGAYRDFMKSALDNLLIDVHIFRVGEYKSAMEPYLRDDMSPEAKEANQVWLTALWKNYTETVAHNRALDPEDIEAYVNDVVQQLTQAGGNVAELARQAELVDGLGTGETFWDYVKEQLPAIADIDKPAIGLQTYLTANLQLALPAEKDAVGIVTIEGNIVDGEAPPGAAAGDSVAELLRTAKDNDSIKAVVLRVNSPGGSAFASEIIREQVLALKEAGKPVVVSMGNIAASGGYWVSAPADEIWASPTTITGSIGIFAAIPNAHRAFNKWGISNDGVGTTDVADGMSLSRPLNPILQQTLQLAIEGGYRRFIDVVKTGRGLEEEAILAAAGGRVWIGTDALNLGLVDQLGEIEDAVQSAAQLANIEGEPHVVHVQDPRWAQLGLMQRLLNITSDAQAKNFPVLSTLERWAQASLPLWMTQPDPQHIYLQCVECDLLNGQMDVGY